MYVRFTKLLLVTSGINNQKIDEHQSMLKKSATTTRGNSLCVHYCGHTFYSAL